MNYAIAIHGGAGVKDRHDLTPSLEEKYLQGLRQSLMAGYFVLANEGSAIDAVESAVAVLEENELFNAGKGSVFNADGRHEMEASIMCGQRVDAGAVCGLRNVRNPIRLARKVLEESNHLFLNGEGAETFARERNLYFEPDEYFYTKERYEQLISAKLSKPRGTGTVGAVALDSFGNLAAATSTGGLTNKKYGRIGDSPVIGAGTYANNSTCAVSCTGDGEFFIRSVAAYDISALMEYGGLSVKEACNRVIMQKLVNIGGEGGAIAIDNKGNIEMCFNSNGMYRGYRKENSLPVVFIY
ncbi:MAG TPA: isoaspartyl peptidase/L-asparaginase [Bacteroidales bacterium]|nr:isoaspartyl peptidase/L-asparaginase [Bacteroidales bacterium]